MTREPITDNQLRILRRLSDAKAAGDPEPLIAALGDPSPRVRRRAARYVYRNVPDRRAVSALVETARSGDPWVLGLVVKALGKIGDPAAADVLFELAKTAPEPGTRLDAMAALGRVGDRRAVTLLLRVLLDDQLEAWLARGRMWRLRPRWVRRWAADRLVEFDAVEAVPRIAEAMPRAPFPRRILLRLLLRRLG